MGHWGDDSQPQLLRASARGFAASPSVAAAEEHECTLWTCTYEWCVREGANSACFVIAFEAAEDQGTSNALLFPPSTRPARALLLPPFKQQAVPSCSSRNAAAQTHMRSNNRAATTAQQQPRNNNFAVMMNVLTVEKSSIIHIA